MKDVTVQLYCICIEHSVQ